MLSGVKRILAASDHRGVVVMCPAGSSTSSRYNSTLSEIRQCLVSRRAEAGHGNLRALRECLLVVVLAVHDCPGAFPGRSGSGASLPGAVPVPEIPEVTVSEFWIQSDRG